MHRDKENSRHYKWGSDCDGWHLMETDELSIIKRLCHQAMMKKYIIIAMLNSFFIFEWRSDV